jgi:hypothetical protein
MDRHSLVSDICFVRKQVGNVEHNLRLRFDDEQASVSETPQLTLLPKGSFRVSNHDDERFLSRCSRVAGGSLTLRAIRSSKPGRLK